MSKRYVSDPWAMLERRRVMAQERLLRDRGINAFVLVFALLRFFEGWGAPAKCIPTGYQDIKDIY